MPEKRRSHHKIGGVNIKEAGPSYGGGVTRKEAWPRKEVKLKRKRRGHHKRSGVTRKEAWPQKEVGPQEGGGAMTK